MTGVAAPASKTLIFVVTEDWYFVSHRLPLAVAARKAGYRVVIASRFSEHKARLEAEGFVVRPIRLRRRGASIIGEVLSVLELRRLFREFSPAVVHHVALKPVLLGSMAAAALPRIAVVNAVAGLGFLFTSNDSRARLLRPIVTQALRLLLRRPRSVVIVQNPNDQLQLIERGLAAPSAIRLMPGAGVELDVFKAVPEVDGVPVVAFAGRLLWSKGIGEFVAAARILKQRNIACRFVLVGERDQDNPDVVASETLRSWEAEGVVELWGRRTDMAEVLSAVHVVCLPSVYGEGVPKILLEAAACGRAVVTTDWPGCRDAILAGETGLLVPPGDSEALAAAIEHLVTDAALRRHFGAAGRRLAERKFDVRAIVAATLAIYAELSS